MSFQSWALLFLGFGGASDDAPSLFPSPLLLLSTIWLACTMLSLWKLFKLRPSSSAALGASEGASVDAISDGATLRCRRSAFCFCSSLNVCSTGRAWRMLSVAVGRMARTVNVQSSWFCSKRRRRLSSACQRAASGIGRRGGCALLAGDALVTDALASFGELAQQVLAGEVASAQDASADGEVGAIAPEPPARS